MICREVDKHGIIKRLTKAKIKELQAEAIAHEIKKATARGISIEIIESRLESMGSKFDSKINIMKAELLKWFVGVAATETVALIVSVLLALMQPK